MCVPACVCARMRACVIRGVRTSHRVVPALWRPTLCQSIRCCCCCCYFRCYCCCCCCGCCGGGVAQIMKHFSHLFALDRPDWQFPGHLCGCHNKRSRMPYTAFHRFVPKDRDLLMLTDVEKRRAKYPHPVRYRCTVPLYGTLVRYPCTVPLCRVSRVASGCIFCDAVSPAVRCVGAQVMDWSHNKKEMYRHQWVCDVSTVHGIGQALRHFMAIEVWFACSAAAAHDTDS